MLFHKSSSAFPFSAWILIHQFDPSFSTLQFLQSGTELGEKPLPKAGCVFVREVFCWVSPSLPPPCSASSACLSLRASLALHILARSGGSWTSVTQQVWVSTPLPDLCNTIDTCQTWDNENSYVGRISEVWVGTEWAHTHTRNVIQLGWL